MGAEAVTLERLRKAMRGGDPEIARGEAFALLAAGQFEERVELLGRVLTDAAEPATTRRAAAIALGRIAEPDAERALREALPAAEPEVQGDVMRSLGRIGGREALAAIDGLAIGPDDPRSLPALFATGLLAHRLGVEGHDLPVPRSDQILPVPSDKARPIAAADLDPDEAAKVLDDLRRQPYGIEYDRDALVRLECAGRVNVVCPNRELRSGEGIARLAKRKALAGVAAYRSPESGDYSVSYLLLTSPAAEGRLRVTGLRCSGRPALEGSGELSGDGLAFRLRAVTRPGGFPLELSGLLRAGRLRFREAKVSLEQVPAQAPKRRMSGAAA